MLDELRTKEFKSICQEYYKIHGCYPAFNYDEYPSIAEYKRMIEEEVRVYNEKNNMN